MTPTGVPVLTAVSDAVWEARLVADLTSSPLGVTVVRRCVDVADLLAVAATGIARAAVVSADLRRLDQDALVRLDLAGVAVIGVVRADDDDAGPRLRHLGAAAVVPSTAGADDVATAIRAAAAEGVSEGVGPAVPDRPMPVGSAAAGRSTVPPAAAGAGSAGVPAGADHSGAAVPLGGEVPGPDTGHLIAVWGPAGAPGRTSIAIGLAAEFAALDCSPLLVDADVYGGTVAALLGLLEETPGLAAACRLANAGTLDLPRLAALARTCGRNLRVLPGISRPARWPELRTAALESVLEMCRSLAPVTVVDCGFSLERDEELMYDTAAPRRNGATLAALAAADTVVVVGSGDPVGIARLVRGLSELAEVVPGLVPTVVINKARRSAVGGDPKREVGAALSRYAAVVPAAYVPYDLAAYDCAAAAGRTVAEVAPGSSARKALAALAADLVPQRSDATVAGTRPSRHRGTGAGLRRVRRAGVRFSQPR